MFKLNRDELLAMFDTSAGRDRRRTSMDEPPGATASALNALLGEDLVLALFCHYWSAERNGPAKILSFDCRESGGNWLDAWVLVESGGIQTLFRTEVKNWTAHSTGGHYRLPIDAIPDEIAMRAKKQWRRWIDNTKNRTRIEKVNLCRPSLPPGFNESKPLLCFWGPLMEECAKEVSPFFKASISGHYLPNVSIFSASIYLRSLNDVAVELVMPRVDQRIAKLEELGVLRSPAGCV